MTDTQMMKEPETQRYCLTIEYDGTEYAGWQRQEEGGPPTIQAALESAIHGFSGQMVQVQGAGRTDAGVHAWAQMAHVDLAPFSKPMDCYEISKAINAYLRPAPISVVHTEIVEPEFHARFAAKNKLYIYRILCRPSFPALEQNRVWHFKKNLDAQAMHKAAQYLIGHHDFSTFRGAQCQAKTPMRTLDRLDVKSYDYDRHGGLEICVEAEAQSFLHHMVRNLVGTLVLVGESKWSPEDIKTAFEAKDRTKGGPTAPASGLYLKHIDYP